MTKSGIKKQSLKALDDLFTAETLSVHIVQGKQILRKQGKPGAWKLSVMSESTGGLIRSKKDVEEFIQQLEILINSSEHAFKEIERKSSAVRQIGEYRIVIVRPPLAPVREITIVRPLVHLALQDYNLDEAITQRISQVGHGILIAGSPGEGKTTFAQALLGSLINNNLVIKTIEAPRDVQLDGPVTQYGLGHATHDEIRDILLLTRPDISLFDEVRNTQDFALYKDLRLAGIGLIGVMHATTAIDALQRSLGVISMGMIAQVIDTVIFIKAGKISEILTLKQVVKTPVGMNSEDLARPVLVVHSLISQKDVYELYTYSDNVVIMPLDQVQSKHDQPPIYTYAEQLLDRQLRTILGVHVKVVVTGPSSITLYAPASETGRIIGRQGTRIDALQKEIGLSISLKSFDELQPKTQSINHRLELITQGRKRIAELHLGSSSINTRYLIHIHTAQYPVISDERGVIVIRKKRLVDAIANGNYTLSQA